MLESGMAYLVWNNLASPTNSTDHRGSEFCLALCSECGDFSIGISRQGTTRCAYHESHFATVQCWICYSRGGSSRQVGNISFQPLLDLSHCYRPCLSLLLGNDCFALVWMSHQEHNGRVDPKHHGSMAISTRN